MQLKNLEEKIDAEFQKLKDELFKILGRSSAAEQAVDDAKTATQQVAVDHVQDVMSNGVAGAVAAVLDGGGTKG